jgi:hypothetical protein
LQKLVEPGFITWRETAANSAGTPLKIHCDSEIAMVKYQCMSALSAERSGYPCFASLCRRENRMNAFINSNKYIVGGLIA